MVRVGKRITILVVLGVAAAATVVVGVALRSYLVPDTREEGPAANVLTAIRDLESSFDPKCHSTACRFEDFIYGTPLTAEARDEKVALQKELVRRIWAEASQLAADAGETSVTVERIRPVIERIVTKSDTGNGSISVSFPSLGVIEVSEVRARQFASIAYSLRAILSVRQDAFLDGALLTTLDDEAVEALRGAVDTIPLCALQLADREARRRSDADVLPKTMLAAWRQLVPAPVDVAAATGPGAGAGPDDGSSAQQSLDIFLAMADNKIAAYDSYNEGDAADTHRRFLRNAQSYYAKFWMPFEDEAALEEIVQAYRFCLLDFSRRLLLESQRIAAEAGHRLIRSADATRAVARLMPHEVDDFEDLSFFFRLHERFQVTIESFDCDSFRDTGQHWEFLKQAYLEGEKIEMIPDPFAAEILSEALSGYGVLLFRVAGKMAEPNQRRQPNLTPQHLGMSRRQITNLADLHHEAEDRSPEPSRIVSSAGSGHADRDSAFFTEVTAESGVDFVHRSTKWLSEFRRTMDRPPTFSGGGVAAEDIDGDSHPDLLFVGGIGNALLISDGKDGFRDVTDQAGIDLVRADGQHGEARQPIIADFDNDGLQDILITYNNDDHRLYRNTGGLRFEDVTERAGLGGRGLIGGPATVFDFDNDGLLDIYIAYFGNYLDGIVPTQDRDNTNALPNKLFRNLGAMRFEDVTAGSGTDDPGWCQAVAHTDFDRDGLQDIVVANDFGRNALLRNLGGGRFENIATGLGITKAYHSMNVGLTDLNRDNFPDVYVSNIATMVKDNTYVFPDVDTPLKFNTEAMASMLVKEANMLYMSRGDAGRLARYEPSTDVERGESSTGWAWDAEFFDFDNDGDDDLYVVNGTNDYFLFNAFLGAEENGELVYYHLGHQRETNVFYLNDGGKLKNRSSASGADLQRNSRSTAYLDWDNDGDLDVAINNFHDPATMLRNNSEALENHWVKVRLIGKPSRGTNRDAIGARMVATNDAGLYLLREVTGGSGYMSMNPKQQHFGLGRAGSLDLEIVWPNGEVQRVEGLRANRSYTIRQGAAPAPETVAAAVAATPAPGPN